MALEQAESISPTGRGAISINFYIPDPEHFQEEQSGTLNVQVRYSDGRVEEKRYDLVARLQDDAAGEAHLANLADLRDYIITRVQTEVIGA